MAFTRFSNDRDVIQKRLSESTFTGIYALNTPGNGLHMPYVNDPSIRLQKWGANMHTNTLNIENDLRGTTRKLTSDCQTYTNFAPITSKKNYESSSFLIDETRASCPAWLFRDSSQYRANILPIDPQMNVEMPFENNQTTRFLEKDYYTLKNKQ
jgi:hypothetical protein